MKHRMGLVSIMISISTIALWVAISEGHPTPCSWCNPAKQQALSAYKAPHGGSLNAIKDIGYVETKLDNDVLKCWFINLKKSPVQTSITDTEITLSITTETNIQSFILKAKPVFAEKDTTDTIAFFEGQAQWLAGMKKFDASGQINFKDMVRNVQIRYPRGYLP